MFRGLNRAMAANVAVAAKREKMEKAFIVGISANNVVKEKGFPDRPTKEEKNPYCRMTEVSIFSEPSVSRALFISSMPRKGPTRTRLMGASSRRSEERRVGKGWRARRMAAVF